MGEDNDKIIEALATIQANVGHIVNEVKEIKKDVKAQGKEISKGFERIGILEGTTKLSNKVLFFVVVSILGIAIKSGI